MSTVSLRTIPNTRRSISSAQLQNIKLSNIVVSRVDGAFKEYVEPIDWVSAVFRFPKLLSLPKGHGEPVVLVPGYFTDKKTLCSLGQFLKFLNYKVFQWDVHHTAQNLDKDLTLLQEHLLSLSEDESLPKITLIGYGLGGILCRAIAKHADMPIKQLITLGTPLKTENTFTELSLRFAKRTRLDLQGFLNSAKQSRQAKLDVPITVLSALDDDFVMSDATIDDYNAHAQHHVISGSHVNYTQNGQVWEIIAKALVL